MAGDVRLIRSPLSVAGMVLTTISATLFLVVFLADLFGLHTNPYIGVVFFLLLPGAFLLGLVLIPLGAWLERRRRAAGKAPSAAHWPRIDLNDARQRRTAVLIFLLTIANVVIVSLAGYRGVEYMDSVAFCGQVCHTVMKPEFVGAPGRPACQREVRRLPCRSRCIGFCLCEDSGHASSAGGAAWHLSDADRPGGAPAPDGQGDVRAVPCSAARPWRQDSRRRRIRRQREERPVDDAG